MEFTTRQIEIIEAAKKLIGEKGIQNITTKNLANEIGFTEAALYRHFKNKNELLNSVLLYYRGQMKKNLSPIVSNSETGLEQLESIFSFCQKPWNCYGDFL